MTWLRALLFNLCFYLSTAGFCIAYLPLLWSDRRILVRGMDRWNRLVNWLLRRIVGLRHEVRGLEHLPAGPCIVAAKHQSAWDTMMFHSLLDDPALVMKKELLRIPLYGTYARRVGMIPVDRSAGATALRDMLRVARACADAGRPIVIFPEGTRVAPGERRRLQAGIAALYDRLDLPVVPVALNSGLFWGRKAFMKRPGTILMEFLPPIPAGLKRPEFIALLEAAIQDGSDRLAMEARVGIEAENPAKTEL
ncbi:lysophospholipid acyltransferase family protein [Marinibaculum pumilum]|uniref:Lysophospholipid acyltransferase family protein n=1 Tax=Marinibaculum pumilum TaxID=1766165 RepID=A0ABV7L615_9PROT